ncbi:hypothetical protein AvCA_26370 [Azotobacter vinelandii CA]|uniref:Uncharacterized protein n=2 Tax=Azotobacter vinelandii TaxID=354 RepID=C1DJP4_AZOVD|nr:hypothetical protein Avin_26370 [Azotobacter vinelandii DJ]AGK14897.1 hypothetical protein AvCA_26370 [Azotobacter vinelandii CA]AGK20767.1 hypothetical protein AvCA6_26370 [Azotobacter vinelandii CA6]
MARSVGSHAPPSGTRRPHPLKPHFMNARSTPCGD